VLRAPTVRGSSLLEAMAASAISLLVLGAAAEHARAVCAMLAETRATSDAMTAARNVLDQALATPCAALQSALSACAGDFDCTLAGREVGRRTEAAGTLVLTRLAVEVRKHGSALDSAVLARLVSIGARPETCG
jgi:hypothetical protein